LPILQCLRTASTETFLTFFFVIGLFGTWSRAGRGGSGFRIRMLNHVRTLQVCAFLTKARFARKRDPFPRGKRFFATGTFETVLMVGFTQGRYDFAFDKSVALGAFSTKITLVTGATKVVLFLGEEATL